MDKGHSVLWDIDQVPGLGPGPGSLSDIKLANHSSAIAHHSDNSGLIVIGLGAFIDLQSRSPNLPNKPSFPPNMAHLSSEYSLEKGSPSPTSQTRLPSQQLTAKGDITSDDIILTQDLEDEDIFTHFSRNNFTSGTKTFTPVMLMDCIS